jgi:hypothetical protein
MLHWLAVRQRKRAASVDWTLARKFNRESDVKIPRSGSSLVRIFGWIVVGVGVLNFVQYYMWKIKYSALPDMGIVTGSAAIMICGAVTLLVANCLRDLEQRIGRLEGGKHTANRSG